MSKIKISIDAPILPADSNITHVSTSWQISTYPDFSLRDYYVYESLNDKNNLLVNYYVTDNLDQPVYVRIQYNFSNNTSSKWSRVIPVRGDQIGLKLSSTVVLTPVVEANVVINNRSKNIVINAEPMKLYSGVGNHKSTSWYIIDSDNFEIFKREKDEDNLTSMTIDASILDPNKAYQVKVKYHTDTNTDSLFGKTLLTTETSDNDLFDLKIKSSLLVDNIIYFGLSLYTNEFNNIDIIIKNSAGITVASNLNQTTTTPNVSTNGLSLIEEYCIYARVRFTSGVATNFKKIWCGKLDDNAVLPKDRNTKYVNQYTFTQEFLLKGATTQSTIEMFNGAVLLTKHTDNNIYYYTQYGDTLIERGVSGKLDGYNDIMDLQYVNILPLTNGKILIDYYAVSEVHSGSPLYNNIVSNASGTSDITIVDDGKNIIKYNSKFALFSYNQTNNTMTLEATKFRLDESYSTSVNNSIVVYKTHAYYIPAEMSDGTDLKIRKLDLATLDITDVVSLPVTGIKNQANLAMLDDNNILFLGGNSATYENDDKEIVSDRINNDLYKYNITTGAFRQLSHLPSTITNDHYALQTYVMRNYHIMIVNGVKNGPALGDQTTHVYLPDTDEFVKYDNDMPDSMSYRNTIRYRNGDISRISSRVEDPQIVYLYPTERIGGVDINTNTSIDLITNLVVDKNEVTTITNPYLYDTVDINGTSDSDTGYLHWQRDDEVIVFKYTDLLVPHDRTMTQEEASKYDNITILDGAHLYIV